MNKVLIKLEKISKSYDNKYVVKDFSLDIYEGEFLTLLGPSGCGKTTVLRMVSGLEKVTSGKVYIDSIDVTDVSATQREVNTIFQNLALFPKMTVVDNISFGLRMKKLPKKEIDKRVSEVIKLVKLNGFEKRYPKELSGGQQQRVAIARGIVMKPKVLLLDESLCSLDLKLKKSMQVELKKIQKKLGITFIYVTHAQDEALSMSDRIVVIRNGIIEQVDTPENIYRHPNNTFVADFIGEANIIDAKVIECKNHDLVLSIFDNINLKLKTDEQYNRDEKIKLVIRPENVKIIKKPSPNTLSGVITNITYGGDNTKLSINIDNCLIKATITDEDLYQEDDKIYFDLDENSIVLLRK